MISAIIVDDETNGRENLKHLIYKFCPQINIVGLASSAEQAVELVTSKNPELVFLDIEMPFKNGFDFLEMLPQIHFDVIFTTAFDHYAVRAIKFSALDYLLKPIDIEELKLSVQKLIQKRNTNESSEKKFQLLLSNLKVRNTLQKIAVPTLDGLVFINISEIIRCEADNNYTRIYCTDTEPTLVSKTLKDYEDMLAGMNFFRIHHANLINLHHVKKYIRGEGGFVVLSDNITVEVSRRRKNEFLKQLSQINE